MAKKKKKKSELESQLAEKIIQLRIESALEKVSAAAIRMKKPEDLLKVCEKMFKEFESLKFPDLRNTMINIHNDEDKTFVNYDYSDTMGKSINHLAYNTHPLIEKQIRNSRKSDDAFSEAIYKGKDLAAWKKFRKKIGEKDDPRVKNAKGLYYYFYSIGTGTIGISTFNPVKGEKLALLKRFRNVFHLSYQRYTDIVLATAQAREARIETALERVRARTMTMQKSEELRDASLVLFEQLKALGEPADQLTIGIINEAKNVVEVSATLSGNKLQQTYHHSIDESLVMGRVYKGWKNRDTSLVIEQSAKELESYNKWRNKLVGSKMFPTRLKAGARRILYVAYFSKGMLSFATPEPRPRESLQLLMRFAGVFDLTYTRFLDLKKAEAQAREAQIEAALEKVRSRSLAMYRSDELREVVALVFEKLNELTDFVMDGVSILIPIKDSKDIVEWVSPEGKSYPEPFRTPYIDNPMIADLINAREQGLDFFSKVFNFDEKNALWKHAFETSGYRNLPEEMKKKILDSKSYAYSVAFEKSSAIIVASIAGEILPEKGKDILRRMAKTFEQAYVRFLDLQKAEAQTREAQIEGGLERVRSRAMAMQSSEELSTLIGTVFAELTKLDLVLTRCIIWVFEPITNAARWWMANSEDQANPVSFYIKYHEHPAYLSFVEAWKKQTVKFIYDLKGQDKIDWDNILFNETDLKYLPDIVKDNMQTPERVILSGSFNNFGGINTASIEPLSEEHFDILLRFAKVFDLTYTRFNDLKQAEAQARESQIQLALERVRARTMAMQRSEELPQAASLLFQQIQSLGMPAWSAGYCIWDEDKNAITLWMSSEGVLQPPFRAPLREDPSFIQMREAYERGEAFYAEEIGGDDLVKHYRYMRTLPVVGEILDSIIAAGHPLPTYQIFHVVYFSQGFLLFITYQPIPAAHDIFKRFGNVFDQTYTRFLDLQRAEQQAREAQIEAALERVRGKAMAMHNSNDLSVSASMVFTELRKLGITPLRCGVGLLHKESRKAQLYSATSSGKGDSLSLVGWVQLENHPVLSNIYDSWLQQFDYFPELEGEQLKKYYELLLAGLSVAVPDTSSGQKQFGTFLPFSIGCLYAWSDTAYNETEIKILKRFAGIIDLTFRRYLELQKAEANAKEAVRQASLDRVRAEIASMRTVNDLQRITPIIWNELTILNVPFIRCGIFIMDDMLQQMHTFLSTPDGKAIASFHLPYNTSGNISDVVKHWQDKKMYVNHWGIEEFFAMGDSLVQQGVIANRDQYLKLLPPDGIHLHFLPFLQGMLYVGNTAELNSDDVHLVQSVADAFSTAYARYEDFNKLEAAKKQVENTLSDLKQAQQQLVQSEKMASLGELTAGIAHEIQNPLNFVNNFSDVSNELIDEMVEEVAKGNYDEAKAIANDVKQNLEKISHHGKRADGIVKGMLQHSRTSSGQKELTDINLLVDEYLRLAYHGLRAKDKAFNAKFETDFDNNIERISIIPQDFGRVILNLINNAFYAVSMKAKQNISGYEPMVTLKTSRTGSMVLISVKDNGIGISQKVLDKIFQPFFTTKPTGQGTGLGLSLAYDIAKAHGGEIKVETRESEGSEFIIQLPFA